MQEINTIKSNGISKIIEKKSKFIGQAFYVETREEAENILKTIKQDNLNAKHNCYAYSILENNILITKSSDDGEPSGTAGMPILNVINENKVVNIIIVVTRYFGGILLGTGGLVRCYTKSAVEALRQSEIIKKEIGYRVKFITNYNKIEILKYYLKQNLCNIINTTYLGKIEIIAEISENVKNKMENEGVKKENMFEKMEILEKRYITKNTI